MAAPQNLKNHMRFDPRFHFFVAPILMLNVIVMIIVAVRYWDRLHWLGVWAILVAAAVLLTAMLARMYNLHNQDRLIRLEERLRYANLLSGPELAMAQGLSVRQIIALRFASDEELPTLMQRALAERLEAKQIKQSIRVWRPDTFRV